MEKYRLEFLVHFIYRVIRNILLIVVGGAFVITFLTWLAFGLSWVSTQVERYPLHSIAFIVVTLVIGTAVNLALHEGVWKDE